MENKNKPTKKFYPYIIFGLILLLSSSLIANIYFYNASQKRIFDCNLGEKIEVEFSEQDNFLLANIVYPSNIVSGTKYNQPIILKTGDITKNYYVRAKAMYADYNIVNEGIEVELSPAFDWEIGPSNYFYLKSKISDFQEISFIDSLTLPVVYTNVKNNTIISIIFEFLDESLDVQTLWKISPENFS